MPYHIAIEGNIGVGKTSLAKVLGDSLDSKLILEEFEEEDQISISSPKFGTITLLFNVLCISSAKSKLCFSSP